MIALYWSWRAELNKSHNSLGKTELYRRHSLRPSSIIVTICPFQFSPFKHAASARNSAGQHISPLSFIWLGKKTISTVWEPSNQKRFHIMKRHRGSDTARDAQASSGWTLWFSLNARQNSKRITSHSAVASFRTLRSLLDSSGLYQMRVRLVRAAVWCFCKQQRQPSVRFCF